MSSQVLDNTVMAGICGGLQISQCEAGSIMSSNISFNRAQGSTQIQGYGGGVCLSMSSMFVIERNLIESNYASGRGGGLAILKVDNTAVTSSKFSSNSADCGGSISARNSRRLNVSDVAFIDSVAISNGGSVTVEDSPHVRIVDSHFSGSQTTMGDGSSIW